MMKVCVITTVHPPDDIRISKELETLVKAGYNVVYIAQKGKFGKDKVEYRPITRYHGRIIRLVKGSREALEQALEVNADIYHFQSPTDIPHECHIPLSRSRIDRPREKAKATRKESGI